MLCVLKIRNFAIVENLEVEFQAGLNVITGETGAGKSILVGALSLLLGERADKTAIRTGESQCSVEGVFRLEDAAAADAILAAAGIEPCEGGRLLLKRTVSAAGGGACHVNGCAATLQAMKKIGDILVDMHGPHDHQSLLDQQFQLDVLDSFGGLCDKHRARYEEAYRRLREIEAQRASLDCDEKKVAEQIEYLSFQVGEISEAAPVEGEDERIAIEHAETANAQRILETATAVCNALSEGESSVSDTLASVQSSLADLAKIVPSAGEWAEEIRSAAAQVRELSRTVSGYAHGIENDPARLQWLEDRIAVYQKLKRKYGSAVPEILRFLEDARKRLNDLETRGGKIAELDRQIASAGKSVASLGAALGKLRRAAAADLAKAITTELKRLGFAKGAFAVELRETTPKSSGTDEIDFGFAPNLGEAMRPLRQIASSGEISRVMLAVKTVLAAHDRIPVLIFDEIDANVGGEMGFAVGRSLRALATSHQAICITHLPQVAAAGTSHFAVTKETGERRTFTRIGILDHAARIEELARMLGGRSPTALTREHAREMLARASARESSKRS